MDLKPLLDELFLMTVIGIKPGLERIVLLCDSIDNPQNRYPIVHVAGTNGKGSTCAMLASILQAAGYKTGLYTSPHILRFNERVRINGEMIPDEDLARLARPLMDTAKPVAGSFFEVTTALAFQWFAEKRVDIAIIETGLGGRLDATNIVHPLVSVITSVDIDHTEYLGTTLVSIAKEKAGIMKDAAPCVIGETLAELRPVFDALADSVNAPTIYAHDIVHVEVDKCHPDLTMTVSAIDQTFRSYYTTDLCGPHQASNIATVLATLPILQDVYFIDEDNIRTGLRNVRASTGLAGRIELVRADPPVVLDVAHNPAGIEAMADTLRACGYGSEMWHVVFGVMADKDALAMLQALLSITDTLHVCEPLVARALPVATLQAFAQSVGFDRIVVHSTVGDATLASMAKGPTLICGSFHVAEEALRVCT